MKKVLLIVMLALFAGSAYGQSLSVSGKVTYADDGSPVVGATVLVEESSTAVLTDIDGMYQITVPSSVSNKSIRVSFAGMLPQTKAVTSNGEVINFALEVDAVSAGNVVVTAYGESSREAFTGSVSVLKSDVIVGQQVSTVSQALQGLASGVIVSNSTGQPGTDAAINIRGIGSINSSSAPLIVMDGIVYNFGLNTINPNDIQTMQVLKDASSTSLYGPRAANGVIMITTKRGVTGKAVVTGNASFGLSDRAVDMYEFVDAGTYMDLSYKSMYNDLTLAGFSEDFARSYSAGNIVSFLGYTPYKLNNKPLATPFDLEGNLVDGAELAYDQDWEDALLRVGMRQEYDMQVRGGTKDNSYLFSVGYLNDQGIVETSEFERFNGRAKIDSKINSWLSAGVNMSVSYIKSNVPMQSGTNTSNVIGWIYNNANIYPAYLLNEDGTYKLDENGQKQYDYGYATGTAGQPTSDYAIADRGTGTGSNPLATTTVNLRDSYRFLSSNNAYVEAEQWGFKFRSQFGIDYSIYGSTDYNNPYVGDGAAYGGLVSKSRNTTYAFTNVTSLSYDNTWGNHHLNAFIGMDVYDNSYDYLVSEAVGFSFPIPELGYGATPTTANSGRYRTMNVSYLSRLNYDYADKYHLTASYSYAGTSRFIDENRWGGFYSVGAAWNMDKEGWFEPISNVVSSLKLRTSYGTSGNQDVGLNPYANTYDAGWNILGEGGVIFGQLGNSNITWESQAMFDAGFDASFLNNTLNLSVTYYNKVSDGLLMSMPLPYSLGESGYWANIGKISNQGVEIDFNATILNTPNVQWTAGFNASWLKTKVIDLPSNVEEAGLSLGGSKQIFEGGEMYSWYLREWAGVDPETGAAQWYIVEEDGTKTKTSSYSSATLQSFDQSLPNWQGGITSNLQLYGFDLSFILSFSIGGKILATDYAGLMDPMTIFSLGRQRSTDLLDAWQQPGDITDVPLIGLAWQSGGTANGLGNDSFTSASTRWLYDATYARLRNITLGYDFTRLSAVKNAGFSRLRLFVSAENPLTFFGGPEGLDPESGIGATQSWSSTPLKSVSFGINIGF